MLHLNVSYARPEREGGAEVRQPLGPGAAGDAEQDVER